jgi:hypothetical protein
MFEEKPVEPKDQVPMGGSWCEDCAKQVGGPVSGERHREQHPDHEVYLRTNGTRWVRY